MDTQKLQIFEAWRKWDEIELTGLIEGISPLEIFNLGVWCIQRRNMGSALGKFRVDDTIDIENEI